MSPRQANRRGRGQSASSDDIEDLRQRYDELKEEKTRAETNLTHAEDELANLQKQAKAAYGTADLNELRKKLAEMTAENEQKRKAYEESLDKIEAELKKVDEEYGQLDAEDDAE